MPMKIFKLLKAQILVVLILLSTTIVVKAQFFTHPGILHTDADFARMRQKVAERAEPWFTAWNNLRNSSEAQLNWNPRATETVIRGGTGDNISIMYRDVAAAYAHALIYNITGDKAHGDKASQILNAWSLVNKSVSGNADRYLAAGLNGYQFANAAELMRDYPAFDFERFKNYMMNVFFYPMNERFLIGNAWGAPHNDACATNYRVNWDACNMNAMLAISILCDHKEGFDKVLDYAKNGDGTGNINRAVNFIHSPLWGQWEESGRDQGHAMGGLMLYAYFCEIAWNQGVDFYGYGDSRFRKGAEYVARYNIMENGVGKYNDLPYTSYSRQMGSTCSWYTEPNLSSAVRGKYGPGWEIIYNHYACRINQGDKVRSVYEILQQQPSTSVPNTAIHPDTYDHPAVATLTSKADSGSYILPWNFMDVMPRSVVKLPHYGKTTRNDSVLMLTASGDGIKLNADHFHFVYQRLIDDGAVVTQFNSLTEPNGKTIGCIMLRESSQQNAAFVMLSLSAANGLQLIVRDSTAKNIRTVFEDPTIKTFPLWLKLSRTGNVFKAFISADGIEWKEKSSVSLNFKRDLMAGPAATTADKTLAAKAEFVGTRIEQGNIRPVLRITSPAATLAGLVAPANLTVAGNTYDMDGSIDKTEIFVNDTLKYSTKLASFSYILRSLPEGNFRILVKTSDNAGAEVTSDTLSIDINPKTEKLPWYKFDETRTGYLSADANGNNLNAMLFGGTAFAAGRHNNGVFFDGVDDYIKLPSTFIHLLSDFSITLWVKPDVLSVWSRIFDFGQGTGRYMMLAADNGNGLYFEQKTDVLTNSLTTNRKLSVSAWTHIAVTQTGNVLSLYLNGTLLARNTNFILRPYDIGIANANYLGKSQFTADPLFKGMMDDMRFFNYALSSQDITGVMLDLTPVENIGYNHLQFYPNPAKELIHLKNAENSVLKIFDASGSLKLSTTIQNNFHTENISNLAPGCYIISIENKQQFFTPRKLIVI